MGKGVAFLTNNALCIVQIVKRFKKLVEKIVNENSYLKNIQTIVQYLLYEI